MGPACAHVPQASRDLARADMAPTASRERHSLSPYVLGPAGGRRGGRVGPVGLRGARATETARPGSPRAAYRSVRHVRVRGCGAGRHAIARALPVSARRLAGLDEPDRAPDVGKGGETGAYLFGQIFIIFIIIHVQAIVPRAECEYIGIENQALLGDPADPVSRPSRNTPPTLLILVRGCRAASPGHIPTRSPAGLNDRLAGPTGRAEIFARPFRGRRPGNCRRRSGL